MEPSKAVPLLQAQIDAAGDGYLEDTNAWRTRSESVLRRAVGQDNPLYVAFNDVRYSPMMWSTGTPDSHFDEVKAAGVMKAVGILRAAILEIEESVPGPHEVVAPDREVAAEGVFLVHGHDGRREEVARVIRQLTGKEPVILHEQPNGGQTIIEKFERHASEKEFAVVLATGDDIGGPLGSTEPSSLRARQNVIFEMGFFVAALGRSRVAVLHDELVELPSDYDGVLYIPLDDNGSWRIRLAREMRVVGVKADANNLK